jgi:hypothetical protein
MGTYVNAYRLLVGKIKGKRQLGIPRCRLVYNIKIDLREMGRSGMGWINMAHETYKWRALMDMVMNIRFHEMLGNSRVALLQEALREGVISIELIS